MIIPRIYSVTYLWLSLLLATTGFSAQQPGPITAQDLISFSSIRNVALNAGAGTLVYELRETQLAQNKYRRHLWTTNLDGSEQRQLTYSAGNEWGAQLSPDGTQVAFFSDRPDAMGHHQSRLWLMPLTGGEARLLTGADRSIIQFKWRGDSQQIYLLTPAATPAQLKSWRKQLQKRGFDAVDRDQELPPIELWVLDLKHPKPQRLFVGDPGITAFDVDPTGELLVYSTNYTGDDNDWVQTDLFLFSLQDSTARRQLTRAQGSEAAPLFSPDGRFIAYSRPQDARKPFSQTEVEIIPVTGEKARRITCGLDHTVSSFHWYNTGSLLLEVSVGLGNQLYLAALDGSLTALSGGVVYLYHSTTQPGHGEIAAVRETPTSLGELVLSKGPGHPWEPITNYSAALEKYSIHPQTSLHWLSRDERFKLEGLVVLPQFSTTKPLPLIVDIHGGPAGKTDLSLQQYGLYQAWAAQGFAVFSPNYRGSEGYGEQFQVANYQDLGGGDYHDIISGVKALIKRGVADPDSLVIMGSSYGGYMTNWVITQTDMFKAAVSKYGIFDLQGDFSNSNFSQWELDYLGHPYWETPALYRQMSPSSFIKRAKTPTLILHGADDENTFTSNSRELARALKTLQVPHHLFLYPREGHGMNEPSHRLDVFQRELSWVNQHLNRVAPQQGGDWLAVDIRVQITTVNQTVNFVNKPGQEYLQLNLLLDASRLQHSHFLSLSDFSLGPEHQVPVGCASGQILTPVPQSRIGLGPLNPAIKLMLVFPDTKAHSQVLTIQGLGTYTIPN